MNSSPRVHIVNPNPPRHVAIGVWAHARRRVLISGCVALVVLAAFVTSLLFAAATAAVLVGAGMLLLDWSRAPSARIDDALLYRVSPDLVTLHLLDSHPIERLLSVAHLAHTDPGDPMLAAASWTAATAEFGRFRALADVDADLTGRFTTLADERFSDLEEVVVDLLIHSHGLAPLVAATALALYSEDSDDAAQDLDSTAAQTAVACEVPYSTVYVFLADYRRRVIAARSLRGTVMW